MTGTDTKTCNACRNTKSTSEFRTWTRNGKPYLSARCEGCQQRYWRDLYAANPEPRRRRAKTYYDATHAARYAARRALVVAAKDRPCIDCKQTYPTYVMDLDHCRGVKDRDVTVMVSSMVPLAVLRAEIAKCDAVCANCHRERTFGPQRATAA